MKAAAFPGCRDDVDMFALIAFRSVMKARLVTPAFLAVFLGGRCTYVEQGLTIVTGTAFGAFVWLKDPKRESDTYLMGAAGQQSSFRPDKAAADGTVQRGLALFSVHTISPISSLGH